MNNQNTRLTQRTELARTARQQAASLAIREAINSLDEQPRAVLQKLASYLVVFSRSLHARRNEGKALLLDGLRGGLDAYLENMDDDIESAREEVDKSAAAVVNQRWYDKSESAGNK